MENFYYAFDVGGTDIKGAIVDENGNIIYREKIPTKESLKEHSLAEAIVQFAKDMADWHSFKFNDASGIGVGLPGLVDTTKGVLKYAVNLNIKNYNFVKEMSEFTSIPVKIANDADLSALAELKVGAGKDFNSFILLTVGTGIGAGIVTDGQILSNNFSGEVGHMKITDKKNFKCACGEIGCYETLASTSALIKLTKKAMEAEPNSKMWKKYTLETVTGKTPFEFPNDSAAEAVLQVYIERLGIGIVNLVNIFSPEAIILSGAISNQKERLIIPLEKYVNSHIFSKHAGVKIKIIPATKTSDAGVIGARFLFS